MKLFYLLLVSLIILGCATPPPPPQKVKVIAVFDKDLTTKLLAIGKNTIKGSALIRQSGGGVVTCAGFSVGLLPVTPYSEERLSFLYGGLNSGFRSALLYMQQRDPFEFTDPEYQKLQKETKCDAQGFFKFENLADGEFFVVSTIVWSIGNVTQGGIIMQRVAVKGGELAEIVLSR